jgi:adenosylcobinamide-phosphate synthase
VLSAQSGKATAEGVRKLLNLSLKLEASWLVAAAGWSLLQ